MEHTSSIEKIGTGLVCSVETYKGARIELVRRTSGFNGLSIYKNGKVRKIEIKTMQSGDKWIAINGVRAIDKLFFERDYWIYFVLVPENIVVMTNGLSFLQQQFKLSKESDYLPDLELWLKTTRKLAKYTGFKFIPRINVLLPIPLRKLVKIMLDDGENKKYWSDSVVEIWENKEKWERVYLSDRYTEI